MWSVTAAAVARNSGPLRERALRKEVFTLEESMIGFGCGSVD
jgi:hypothetical protein